MKIKKIFFLLMGVLLLLRYIVTPISIIANTIDNSNNNDNVILKQISLDTLETKPNLSSFNINLNIKEDINSEEPITIFLNSSININKVEKDNLLKSTINYRAEDNKIIVDTKTWKSDEVRINISIENKNLRNVTHLIASLGNQVVSIEIPEYESNEQGMESSQSSDKTENSIGDEAEELENLPDQNLEHNKKQEAKLPQDIRQILVNKGFDPATIIDDAKIVYVDKDGKPYPDQTNVPIDAEVQIDYSWSLPENILPLHDGDYFDFKLPEGVTIEEVAASLGDYGSYSITPDGMVHFVFNKKVETDHDIKGKFHYDAHFDETTVPGETTISTPTEENFPPSEVHIHPKYDQAIDKSGRFDKTPNPTKVIWELNINRPLNKMENATVTDPMPKGTNYESVVIYPETVGPNGEIVSIDREHPLVEGLDFTVDENGKITFIGKYASTNLAFNIIYTTSVDEKNIPEDGGTIHFENTATLNDGKTDTNASASVDALYKGTISKNGPFSTGNDQIYNWNIEYNYNEKIHKEGSYIEDTMSDSIDLIDGSVQLYKITFDKDGKEVKGETLKAGEDYQVIKDSNNPQKFKIEFLKDINYAVKVEYQTKIKDIVDDNVIIDNTVETDTGHKDEAGGNATQQGVEKNVDGKVDYSKQEIPWKIDVNKAGYWMENWLLEDTMSEGLIFLEDTFQIVDKTAGDIILSSDKYSLEKTSNGFKISFKSPLKEGTDHKYQITYKTKFKVNTIDNGTGHESEIKYKNDVSMIWKDKNGDNHMNEDHQDFEPIPPFQYNGQKSGTYNATSKKITWTVVVNFNQQELTNSSIVDPILDGQDYVSNSTKIFEAIINKDGTYTLGKDVSSTAGIHVTEDESDLKITLPEGSKKAYVLIFETSLDGKIINQKEYKNKATFTNNEVSHDLSASVTPAHQGELISKDGGQSETDSNYVNWTLTVNASQSTLKDVEVIDKPSSNQYIDLKDIVIFGTTIDSSGKISKDFDKVLLQDRDYTVDIQTDNTTGAQIIKIKFLSEINTAYMIEYKAFITSDKVKDTVTNEAHLTGTNEETINQDIKVKVPVVNHNGSSEGSSGSITLQKLGLHQEKLEGAHFQLWSINKGGTKDTLIREGDTDVNGNLKLGNLRVSDYLLFETKAPDGYNISSELIAGKKITISKDGETPEFPIKEIFNDPTKVILKKTGVVNEDGKENLVALQGAEFKVLDSDGNIVPGYESITSNNLGIVLIERLQPGNYSIVETKAPDGYILDTTPIKFELKVNEVGVVPEVHLERKNYKGTAELIKRDSTGNPLAQAKFKVVDKAGKIIKEGLTSDKDGKVTISDLAPGDYSFVETKAPVGYILNMEPVEFTISSESKDKPKVVIASNNFVNYKGTARLIKVDDYGRKLSGAIFSVINSNTGEVILENIKSDVNGNVTVKDLAPGKYSFVETKSPDGYELSSQKKEFEITERNEGEPNIVNIGEFINKKVLVELTNDENSEKNKISKYSLLPITGEQRWNLLSIGGVLLVIGIIFFYKNKKK